MGIFEAIDDIFRALASSNNYTKALVLLVAALGAFVTIILTLKFVFNLIQGFRLYFCNQLQCCQTDFIQQYGKWAVVTGATDGIGQSMARELARRGMSIIVVGRNGTKLAATKAMLEAEPNVGDVETVKIDLSDSSIENFASIREQIDPDNRDIGMLINNAGVYPHKFKRINKFEMSSLLEMANLNMIAPMHMIRMIMPGMVSRGKGLVVNVSSLAGDMPIPYMSIYASTKKFLNAFTQQLQLEYASHPIDILLLTPGPVCTARLVDIAQMQATLFSPSSDDYARSAINALSARVSKYSGTTAHGLMSEFNKLTGCLGLQQAIYTLFFCLLPQYIERSPVPKRKTRHS